MRRQFLIAESIFFSTLVTATPLSLSPAIAHHLHSAAGQTEVQGDDDLTDVEWRERLLAVKEGDRWYVGANLGRRVSALPGDRALRILEPIWPEITSRARPQILKGFKPGFSRRPTVNPQYFEVMHLGMMDPDLEVRKFAVIYINQITLQDFTNDPDSYRKWRERTQGRPATEICIDECRRFMQEVRALDQADVPEAVRVLSGSMNDLREVQALRETILAEGLLEVIERWIETGVDPASLDALVGVLFNLHVKGEIDDAYLERLFVPLIRNGTATIFKAACTAVRLFRAPWAVAPILERMTDALRSPGDASRFFSNGSYALGEIGDPRAIPRLIAVIEADERYGLNKQAMRYLGEALASWATPRDVSRGDDAAFWRNWWKENRHRFDEPVRSLDIPTISLDEQTIRTARIRLAGERLNAVLVQESFAGGDVDKRYYLIGPRPGGEPPVDGYKLLLILPGGDGSADFHPWCTRVVEEALPEGYLGVELVAPVWTNDPERTVWPTRQAHGEDVKFTTDDFILEVVEEVKARVPVDDRFIFTLGWSSGGPPIYSMSLQPDSVVTGTFVAMSVFKPMQLPSLDAAKGHAYYILHSPDDWIPFDEHAKRAERELREQGARVKLATYSGGHGWTDDPFVNIRRGIEWLEVEQLKP